MISVLGDLYCYGKATLTPPYRFSSHYLINPSTLTTTPLAVSDVRTDHGMINIGDYIYLIGGSNSNGAAFNKVERYDIISNTFSTLSSLPNNASYVKAGLFEGKIFAISGAGDRKVYVYDIVNDTWESRTIPTAFDFIYRNIAYVDGYFYCFGGRTPLAVVSDSATRYSVENDTWEYLNPASNMPANFLASTAVLGDNIYIFGGFTDNGITTNSFYCYKISSNEFVLIETEVSPAKRSYSTMTTLDNKIYLYNGRDDTLIYGDLWEFTP
ncbi:MAG: hypothetical protein M0P09_00340 [Acholeplasmataceae bacterium]|nr:hypothetical protein [Acholeplasmataceae bacterium]